MFDWRKICKKSFVSIKENEIENINLNNIFDKKDAAATSQTAIGKAVTLAGLDLGPGLSLVKIKRRVRGCQPAAQLRRICLNLCIYLLVSTHLS